MNNATSTNTAVLTTPEYWDCECDKDYIHPAHELFCQMCGAFKDDQPDARVDEVKAAGLPLANGEEESNASDFFSSFTRITVHADGSYTIEPPRNNKKH